MLHWCTGLCIRYSSKHMLHCWLSCCVQGYRPSIWNSVSEGLLEGMLAGREKTGVSSAAAIFLIGTSFSPALGKTALPGAVFTAPSWLVCLHMQVPSWGTRVDCLAFFCFAFLKSFWDMVRIPPVICPTWYYCFLFWWFCACGTFSLASFFGGFQLQGPQTKHLILSRVFLI